ncbi:N-acetylglucosamine-1-phosphate uridyltransferase, partial [Halobacteriales archaeon QS_5_68_33]
MRRIGFVVNPIAGMGGPVGLKGTDGKVAEARRRGAEPRARERARVALDALAGSGADVELLTYGAAMGERVARAAGFDPVVVGRPDSPEGRDDDGNDVASAADNDVPPGDEDGTRTTAGDTRAAVAAFVDRGVDLILFVGGDGTATDVAEELDRLHSDVPILGVPAGVKIYSSVFAVRPAAAGRVAATFAETETGEVNDIDEDDYREGRVSTNLRAVVETPAAAERQASKQLGGGSVETLAEGVAEDVRDGVTYVLGPGGTLAAVKDALGFEGSPIGVDVWRDGEVLVGDGGAAGIEAALGEENVVVVSPIGGQGFVFGRGNQQISPAVIRRSTVEIVASRSKL